MTEEEFLTPEVLADIDRAEAQMAELERLRIARASTTAGAVLFSTVTGGWAIHPDFVTRQVKTAMAAWGFSPVAHGYLRSERNIDLAEAFSLTDCLINLLNQEEWAQ